MIDNVEYVDEFFNIHKVSDILGQGGQGRVSRTYDPDIAVKLVIKNEEPITEEKELNAINRNYSKIRMIPLPNDIHLSRPVAILKNAAGYVMQLMSDMRPFTDFWHWDKYIEKIIERNSIPDWLNGMPQKSAAKMIHYIETGGLRRRLIGLYKCASVLSRLHAAGLVYGDISFNNIYLSNNISSNEVWLIDADNLSFEKECSDSTIHTPEFGAPEILQGVDGIRPRTDCHAFAVLAFKLITMEHPFIGPYIINGVEEDDWANEDASSGESLEEKALKGLIPWIDDKDDKINSSTNGIPRHLLLTEELMSLFQETFGPGRTNFWRRPTIYHWPESLARAADLTVNCPNCKMGYYWNQSEDQTCPYCQASIPASICVKVYSWAGPGSLLDNPDWIFIREYEGDNHNIELPNRLFYPFSFVDDDKAVIELMLSESKITVKPLTTEGAEFSIAVNKNNADFKEFISLIELHKEAYKSGIWLYVKNDKYNFSKLANISFLGRVYEN